MDKRVARVAGCVVRFMMLQEASDDLQIAGETEHMTLAKGT